MNSTEAPTDRRATSPSQAFGTVLNAIVGSVATRLERTTAGWIDRLDAVTESATSGSGGALQHAGVEGFKAHVAGKSPVRAAIRGAWEAGTPAVRAAIITAGVGAVLLLLLSPVLLLVYLLSWLVLAAVHRTQETRQRRPATA